MHEVDELRCVDHLQVARAGQIHGALGQDATRPRAHGEHPVGKERRFAQIVGDQYGGEALLRLQIADDAPQLLAGEGVEGRERLVEHQQLRLVDEGTAQRRPLLHAPGELPGELLARAFEPYGREQRIGPFVVGGAVPADVAAVRLDDLHRQQHVRPRRAPREHHRVLERHARDADGAGDRVAGHPHRPCTRELEPGHELHERGLAAAGRSDHGDELALGDREAQSLDRKRALHGPVGPVPERDALDVDERCCHALCPPGRPRAVRCGCRRGRTAPARQGTIRSALGGKYCESNTSAAFGRLLVNS